MRLLFFRGDGSAPTNKTRTLMTYTSLRPPAAWPNFFLVGAPRCGTTAIVAALEQHPDVYPSPVKEPNFFCPDVWVEDVVGKSHLSRHGRRTPIFHALIRDEKEYLGLYKEAAEYKAVGDYSVNYLRSKQAPSRIFAKSPVAKIVISLRNPIERAYSHFLMECRIGRVSPPFENVIAKHVDELGLSEFDYDNYVECSLYFESVKRYIDVFGRENVLVVLYDDLLGHFESTIAQICRHIGLSAPANLRNIRKNDSTVARFQRFNRILYRSGVKTGISRIVPYWVKEAGKRYYYRSAYDDGDERCTTQLSNEIFVDDLSKLSELLGRDLSHWLAVGTNSAVPAVPV